MAHKITFNNITTLLPFTVHSNNRSVQFNAETVCSTNPAEEEEHCMLSIQQTESVENTPAETKSNVTPEHSVSQFVSDRVTYDVLQIKIEHNYAVKYPQECQMETIETETNKRISQAEFLKALELTHITTANTPNISKRHHIGSQFNRYNLRSHSKYNLRSR